MFKEILLVIVSLINWLVNKSFGEGIFPNCTKIPKVNSTYIKEEKNEVETIRPIFLLLALSKFLEILFNNRLVSFFKKHRFLFFHDKIAMEQKNRQSPQ